MAVGEVQFIMPRLTKAQKHVLVKGEGSVCICQNLKRKGLVSRIDGTGDVLLAYPEFTERGLAVRQYLKENPGHEQ